MTNRQTSAEPAPTSADFRDLTLDEVEQLVASAGERAYRARQILHWVHARGAESFDEMRDLPAALRNYLKQNFTIGHPVSSFVSRSTDGTRKLLIRLDDARRNRVGDHTHRKARDALHVEPGRMRDGV